MKKLKNRKILIYSLFIIGVVLVMSGFSYAYFTASSQSNSQTITSGVLELTYETGQDIDLENAYPTTEENASISKFSIVNTGTLDTEYNIHFANISLTKDGLNTTSNNLKWALYESNQLLSSGSFGPSDGYFIGDQYLRIYLEQPLAVGEEKSFILKVWLQETGEVQNEDQGLSLNFQLFASTSESLNSEVKRKVYSWGDQYAYGYESDNYWGYNLNYTTFMGQALMRGNRLDRIDSGGANRTIDLMLEAIQTGRIESEDWDLDIRERLAELSSQDILTLSFGTFDFSKVWTDAGVSTEEDGVTAALNYMDQFISIYDQLLTEVTILTNSHVIVFGPLNTAIKVYNLEEDTITNQIFDELDQRMIELCQKHSVEYVSGYQLFKGKVKTYFEQDGTILTEAGFRLISNAMMDIVQSYSENEIMLLGLGDSIGVGVLANGLSSTYTNGYNQMLYDILHQENANYSVFYGAVSGSTIENYLEAIQTGKMTLSDGKRDYPLADNLKALDSHDIVTFSITGNDIIQKIILSGTLDNLLINQTITKEEVQLIIDDILTDYETFLIEMRNVYSGHFITLGVYNMVIPAYALADDSNPLLTSWLELMDYYDQRMQEISASYNVDYVSGYQLFKGQERTYFPIDRDVHPNEAGYRLIANKILEVIRTY